MDLSKNTYKITLGVYELGSVFKTFTIANALELKLIDENTLFKNLEKPAVVIQMLKIHKMH